MIEYVHGWIRAGQAAVFWWTGYVSYITPFDGTNVPIGIDGLEFV